MLLVPGMFECALKVLEGHRYQAMVQLGNVLMDAGAIAIGIIIFRRCYSLQELVHR